MKTVLLVLVAMTLLTSCGQSGPLYLPSDTNNMSKNG